MSSMYNNVVCKIFLDGQQIRIWNVESGCYTLKSCLQISTCLRDLIVCVENLKISRTHSDKLNICCIVWRCWLLSLVLFNVKLLRWILKKLSNQSFVHVLQIIIFVKFSCRVSVFIKFWHEKDVKYFEVITFPWPLLSPSSSLISPFLLEFVQ